MGNSFDPKKIVPIHAFKDGKLGRSSLHVIVETPLTLYLEDKEIVTLLYNGQNPKSLAAGFFFSEGFIDTIKDIKEITFDANTDICKISPTRSMDFYDGLYGKRLVTSGCGKGSSFYNVMDSVAAGKIKVESDLTMKAEKLCLMAYKVFKSSDLYRQTHGVHSAGLCDLNDIIVFHDDIGRHNALDKIAGQSLLEGIKTSDKILYSTGRITSEVMIKAGRMACPIVVSRSSATTLALELAHKTGITVVGGARRNSFHVYCGAKRIIADGTRCSIDKSRRSK